MFHELNLPKHFFWIYLSLGRVFWVHHCSKTCILLVHHSILVYLYHLSIKFCTRSLWNYLYIFERKNLSVRYHLGILKCGVSLEGYFKSGVSLEKSKRVDWNHNPIVLLEGLVWKPWISGTSSLGLKLEESGYRSGYAEPL